MQYTSNLKDPHQLHSTLRRPSPHSLVGPTKTAAESVVIALPAPDAAQPSMASSNTTSTASTPGLSNIYVNLASATLLP